MYGFVILTFSFLSHLSIMVMDFIRYWDIFSFTEISINFFIHLCPMLFTWVLLVLYQYNRISTYISPGCWIYIIRLITWYWSLCQFSLHLRSPNLWVCFHWSTRREILLIFVLYFHLLVIFVCMIFHLICYDEISYNIPFFSYFWSLHSHSAFVVCIPIVSIYLNVIIIHNFSNETYCPSPYSTRNTKLQ